MDDRIKCALCGRFVELTTVLGWVHVNCWTDHDPEPVAVALLTTEASKAEIQ